MIKRFIIKTLVDMIISYVIYLGIQIIGEVIKVTVDELFKEKKRIVLDSTWRQ